MPRRHLRIRAGLYLWLDRWLERLARLFNIIHEGFWLGWFDAEDMNAATVRSFERSGTYNGPEHNRSGLFPWEREAIDRFFSPGSRILVAAAGGGREMIALHQLGFQVDGFDCAPSLVETGRRLLRDLHIPSNVMLCPPNDVPRELPPYDGLVVGWSALMHIPGTARRIAFIRKLRQCVRPGAPLLASFWVRMEASPDEVRTFRLAARIRSLRGRRAEPLESGDHLTGRGYHHCFTREELEAEFTASGFRVRHYSQVDHPYIVGLAE
jgi:hypothetical protein